MAERKKIIIVGVGYVGLPTAVLLARAGHEVVGVDKNPRIVETLNRGVSHVDEEDLKALMGLPEVRKNLKAKATIEPADVFMIAVPTPIIHDRLVSDLSMVEAATREIAPHLRKGNLVILESTVPPGTCKNVIGPILAQHGFAVGTDILVAHCPERVLPGAVVHEIVHNDRIIGGINATSTAAARALYKTFTEGTLIETDDVTAELCKLMENTFRDVNIALANEFSAVCAQFGVDAHGAIAIANRHPRVNILTPGIGVGGHCIPVDPWFIAETAPRVTSLIPAARRVNDAQPARMVAMLRKAVADIADPRIVCLGATYKADTYDLRESPALEIASLLKEDGYDVRIVDPITEEYASPIAKAAEGCDLVVVLVPHKRIMAELKSDRTAIAAGMRNPRIFDLSGGVLRPL